MTIIVQYRTSVPPGTDGEREWLSGGFCSYLVASVLCCCEVCSCTSIGSTYRTRNTIRDICPVHACDAYEFENVNVPPGTDGERMNILGWVHGKIHGCLKVPRWRPTYNEDGLYTNHNCDCLETVEFKWANEALQKAEGIEHRPHRWRLATLLWAERVAAKIPGDYVQCGVYLGGSAAAIQQQMRAYGRPRQFYLFDTFTAEAGTTGKGSPARPSSYKHVTDLFKDARNVKLVRGVLPESLNQVLLKEVSFLHLDLNVALTESVCLTTLWPKMVPGAVVVLESYGYPGYEECKDALDAVARNLQISILSLPIGQGLARRD